MKIVLNKSKDAPFNVSQEFCELATKKPEDRNEYDRLNALRIKYRWYEKNDVVLGWCFGVIIVCAIGLLITSLLAIVAKVNTNNDKAYDMYNTQYSVLEYRLSEEENVLTNIDLYNAVIEYNNSVISAQKACENPFVDIFQDQSVMKNKIIDVSKLKYGRVEE